MKFESSETWYLASRGLTGFVVLCPIAGLRDEVSAALIGIHEIDGQVRYVVAVESYATMRLSENSTISLMVRGKLP